MNDLERASAVLRSVDWVLPAYLPADGILAIAAMLEHEPESKREDVRPIQIFIFDPHGGFEEKPRNQVSVRDFGHSIT